MSRLPVTVEVDSNLVEAARSAARRAGVDEADLYERALREVLVRDFSELMDDVAAFQTAGGLVLDEEEAERLAASEVAVVRVGRRNRSR